MALANSLIDKFVGLFNPEAELRRAKARLALDMLRGYEGASKGRRTDGWKTGGGSARTETQRGLVGLRERSRDLVRNNPYAARAVKVIRTNTVGTGIVPGIKGDGKRKVAAVKAAWEAWAETAQCDADGRRDFYGIQALVQETVAQSGECLIRRRWRRSSDGLAIPLQLQVLEPDFIDTSKDTLHAADDGKQLVQGIQLDKLGRRVAYNLYKNHPGDAGFFSRTESSLVPAQDIIHVFREDRPGQLRGVAWAAPIVLRLRDLDEYEDAQLLRQKIAALFAAFVTDMDGGPPVTGGKDALQLDEIQAGAIQYVGPGKSIEFPTPPGVNGYGEYTTAILRSIAVGMGISYESLTGDLTNVNFSSGRMGWLEFHRNVQDWRWQMLIPQLCGGTWNWFLEAAAVQGLAVDGVKVEWTPPKREMIDPATETKAKTSQIRAGLISLPEAIREDGMDPDAVLGEIAETNKQLDELGIKLDSDPRYLSQNGQSQLVAANDNSKKNQEDEDVAA